MSRVARPLLTQGVRRTLSLAVLVCLGLVLTLTALSDPLPEWTRPVGTEISRRACLERRELWSAFFLAMLPVLADEAMAA